MKTKPKRIALKRLSGYLVATFEKFPGVEIPLLSKEECRARGIEPGIMPPFHAWTPEQQTALYELAEVIAEMAMDGVICTEVPGTHG